jgi:6-phosphogluconolactonase
MVIGDLSILREVLASVVAAEGNHAVAERGRFTIAIPGGSVASAFFPDLAILPFDWSKAEFFWTDERAVPPTHPDSNYGIARSLWLDPANVPAARIHRMPADLPDVASAGRAYEAELKRLSGDPPILDLVLLGVGPDGHVASLFPGQPVSAIDSDLVAAVDDAPKPPARRLTLTLPVLTRARRVIVAALGRSKAAAIQQAVDDGASPLPLAIVLRRAARPLLLIDEGAASALAR